MLQDPTVAFCKTATIETVKFLQAHPELCVLSSDKGNRVVIMEMKDYEGKMSALVSDENTYEKVSRDPTSGFQAKSNNLVKRLSNLKLIDHQTKRYLTIHNSTCPRIYGQPKAHNTGLPLHPVIPNVTSPTYRISKFFANILSESLKSKYSTRSSFDFCEEINGVALPEDHIIISLDVVSLFTNVPRDLVTKMIIERLQEINTTINLDLLLEAIDFCMQSSYFQYKNQYYRQTYGTAMGSPLSPILADIVLNSIIDQAVRTLPFEVPLIRKYVDDLFLAIPKDAVNTVLSEFNKQESRLQFTLEEEQNRTLPFLDMIVIRKENQQLTTDWYAKPIASGRMLNYHSCHQMKQKLNVASNFIFRVTALSRNSSLQHQKDIIYRTLQTNGYPKTLVSRLIQHQIAAKLRSPPSITTAQPDRTLLRTPPSPPPPPNAHHPTTPTIFSTNEPTSSTLVKPRDQALTAPTAAQNRALATCHQSSQQPRIENQPNEDPNTPPNQLQNISPQAKLYRSLPYVPMLTERISKMLTRDYPHIQIANRQHRTVNQFFSKVKDPKSKLDKHSIIYKIPCNNCNSCYIGMTNNKLSTRLVGHKSNIKKLDEIIEGTNTTVTLAEMREKTALLQHCIDTEHRFSLDSTNIVDSSRNINTLSFLEMCHIHNTPQAVNKRTDTAGLNTAYAALLTGLKNNSQSHISSSHSNNSQDNTQNSQSIIRLH